MELLGERISGEQDQLLQSERLATIGKFASDMAHEIKNPLQAILTFFEYLPKKYDDPDFRERFSKIAKEEAQRISDLVKELATYANPRPPQFAPVEISQVLDSVLALLENDLHKHRVTLQKGYSHSPMRIEADLDQMKQVFLNLILNAVEAMSPLEGKENLLEIVAYPNGKVLVVKLRDTGCGIEPGRIPVIFAPFFTTKERGSGLGLSIVQNVLRAHHATIEVESQVGQGTTVTLTIPVRQPAVTGSSKAA